MKRRVYVETSIISYLASRLSRDLIVAGHQQITQEWWAGQQDKFEVFVSQTVLEEATVGDQEAAQQAKDLVRIGPLPEKAEVDALHIAIAVTNRVDYLLTWNCKHLANAALRNGIEHVCRSRGYDPVIICTPEELLED